MTGLVVVAGPSALLLLARYNYKIFWLSFRPRDLLLSWRRWTLRRSTSTWPSTSIRPTGWFLFSFSLTAELFFSVFRT